MAFLSRGLLKAYPHTVGSNMESLMCRFSVSATSFADKPTSSKGGKKASPAKPPVPPPAAPTSKGDTYQAQDFFDYNVTSYYEIESDMRKFRLKQPTPGVPDN